MKTTNQQLRKLNNKRYIKELEIIELTSRLRHFIAILFNKEKDIPIYFDNPEYQRDLVWSLEDKQLYILNLFKGLAQIKPMIAVYYNKDNVIYEVIDGKQRLNAIFEFINNKFPLYVNDEEIYFDNLQEEDQKYLMAFDVKWTRVMSRNNLDERIPLDYLLELFIEINFLGTKMTNEDLLRVDYLKNNL